MNKRKFLIITILFLLLNIAINMTIYRGDVFDIHLPTKDEFGLVSFINTVVFGIVISGLIYYAGKKNWKLENIYLLIVIPMGILFMIANPLGKVPDENMHARKAMAVSEGNFISKADERAYATHPMNPKLEALVSRDISSYDEAEKIMALEETDEKVNMQYNNMALYAPICHMAPALGIAITRLFGANLVIQCYAGRAFNMALAIFIMYMAIKIMPYKKHLLFFMGLLPISINLFASMSSDALAISFGSFYISYILHLKYEREKVTKKSKIALAIFSVIIALLKIVYIPLVFLMLLVPKDKFESKKSKIRFSSIVIIISIILNVIWLIYCTRFLQEFNPGVDSKAQTIGVLSKPFSYILIMFRTANTYMQTFIVSLCGEGLGHYNVQTSVIYVFSCIMLATVIFFAKEEDEKIEFTIGTKIACCIIFLVIAALIYTSLYVQWTEYAKPVIKGVQARYFIPIMPLFAIVIDNKNLLLKSFNKSLLSLYMLYFNLNAICMILFTYIDGNVLDFYIK